MGWHLNTFWILEVNSSNKRSRLRLLKIFAISRILIYPPKCFDLEVLRHLLEKYFNIPTLFIKVGDNPNLHVYMAADNVDHFVLISLLTGEQPEY